MPAMCLPWRGRQLMQTNLHPVGVWWNLFNHMPVRIGPLARSECAHSRRADCMPSSIVKVKVFYYHMYIITQGYSEQWNSQLAAFEKPLTQTHKIHTRQSTSQWGALCLPARNGPIACIFLEICSSNNFTDTVLAGVLSNKSCFTPSMEYHPKELHGNV